MKRNFIYFLLCSLILFSPLERIMAKENDKSTYLLRHLFSFPTADKEVFISYPSFMVLDQDSNIFISDNMGCQILKFSLNGKLLKTFGRKGQGPGDLLYPNSICCGENKFFVTEAGNSRIQIFDLNGYYLSSFRVISPPKSMLYFDKKLYAINVSIYDDKEPLIAVYNLKGKILKKFGDLLNFKDGLHPFISKALIKIYKNKLYVLFVYYPILKIYNLDGELIHVYDFPNRNYESRVPGNYDWPKLKAGKRVLPTKFLFKAFDVNNLGLYIALYDNDIIIDHYALNGEFLARYKVKHENEPFDVFDFFVLFKKNNTKKDVVKFYILNSTDVPKVDIFSINH